MDIERYTGSIPATRAERRAQRATQDIAGAAYVEQARLQAIATTTQFGMFQYVQAKRLQNDLEKLCPDATEGLAGLANNALFAMTQSLQQFGQGIA